MPTTRPVPPDLCDRPVTREELLSAGLSWAFIRAHFTALFRGVWWHGPPPDGLVPWLLAALKVLPPGSLVSHVTALQLRGIDLGGRFPVHFSTRTTRHTIRDRLVLHRRIGTIWLDEVRGLATTTPERAFVDSATLLGLRDLVRAGDALVHAGLVTLDQLRDFCVQSHLDGVVRARRAVALVREGVESFLETDVRLILVFARLPVDGCNIDILDDAGRFVARGDILFSRFKVLVEYDGWHHERDARPPEGPLAPRTARGRRLDRHRRHDPGHEGPARHRPTRHRSPGSSRLPRSESRHECDVVVMVRREMTTSRLKTTRYGDRTRQIAESWTRGGIRAWSRGRSAGGGA